ncbi:MAG: di-trans,poly-cis-decaprenylcistransferase, partial [Planctomycetaceae bacterium]|nr:di-trans,poly-cis-decaprenylcistransferase [Planctomycetaceae bacterium]
TQRGLPRTAGHQAGAETVRRVVTFARRRGIRYLTLYAFSTENWSRPAAEVSALMALLGRFVKGELPTMLKNEVRLRIMGDRSGLSKTLQSQLLSAEDRTAGCAGLDLVLAINYGGRDEIARAASAAMRQLLLEGKTPGDLDADALAARLDSAGIPDPDLIIRTAGEMRLSNFLLWQGAYAELVFRDRLWPDFDDGDFEAALAEYAGRVRKFGSV